MKHRLINLLPLLLCLALWTASHLYRIDDHLRTHFDLTDSMSVDAYNGRGAFHYYRLSDFKSDIGFAFLGFEFRRFPVLDFPGMAYWITIPLWSPTALSALFAILFWRKSKRKSSSAFPIELPAAQPPDSTT